MNILDLAELMKKAINSKPHKSIHEYCGNYYEPYYKLFYLCAMHMFNQGVVVELGVNVGRGSFSFIQGGIETIGIDHTRQSEIDKLEEYSTFTFLNCDTLPVPDYVKDKKIALLHIDTEHSASMAKAEFEAYEPYLIDGAIVFFDDLNAAEKEVHNYFITLKHQKIIAEDLHPSCGFGAIVYQKEKCDKEVCNCDCQNECC